MLEDYTKRKIDVDESNVEYVRHCLRYFGDIERIIEKESPNFKGFVQLTFYCDDRKMLRVLQKLRNSIFQKEMTIYLEKIC